MTQRVRVTLPLTCWRGDRGTYHLLSIVGEQAQDIATHARLHRLEFGRQRGFGSVKTVARIGDTEWKTSVFPQAKASEWILLVSKKVMQSEGLAEGDPVALELDLL